MRTVFFTTLLASLPLFGCDVEDRAFGVGRQHVDVAPGAYIPQCDELIPYEATPELFAIDEDSETGAHSLWIERIICIGSLDAIERVLGTPLPTYDNR